MRDKKKSYWTVFEKMMSEVEKHHKSTKIAKIKNLKKKNTSGRTRPYYLLSYFRDDSRKDFWDTDLDRRTDGRTDGRTTTDDNPNQ